MWLIILSDQLLIVGLVGRYPANYLIRRRLILHRLNFHHLPMWENDNIRYYQSVRTVMSV